MPGQVYSPVQDLWSLLHPLADIQFQVYNPEQDLWSLLYPLADIQCKAYNPEQDLWSLLHPLADIHFRFTTLRRISGPPCTPLQTDILGLHP